MAPIMIDPGHGGRDPGASGYGMQEKILTFKIAAGIAGRLRRLGYTVLLTRSADEYVELGQRPRRANDAGARLLLSVHVNAAGGTGFESFVHPSAGAGDRAICRKIHGHVAQWLASQGFPDRGQKEANLGALRGAEMPALLVECLFIDRAEDAAWLSDDGNVDMLANEFAWVISQAIPVGTSAEPPPAPEGTPIAGQSRMSIEGAWRWARDRNAHPRFLEQIIPALWAAGGAAGIRPEVLVAQSALETGFGRFGGTVAAEQHNTAGIKTARAAGDGREDHETFPTWPEGARAHANHLGAYAGIPPVGEPHGRWHVAAAMPWAGKVMAVEDLGGKWAPAEDYGTIMVRNYLTPLLTVSPPPERESVWKAKYEEAARKLEAIRRAGGWKL